MANTNETTKERLDQLNKVDQDIEEQRNTRQLVRETTPRYEKDVKHQIENVGAVWSDYTPSWTAPTTAPALANGELLGRYIKIGRLVHLNIHLTAGSSTTFGSGAWSFSVPFTSSPHGMTYTGSVYMIDSGTTNSIGVAVLNNDSDTLSIYLNSNANAVKSDNPWTWASGDELAVELSYETS